MNDIEHAVILARLRAYREELKKVTLALELSTQELRLVLERARKASHRERP